MAVFVVSDPVSTNQPTKYVIAMDGGQRLRLILRPWQVGFAFTMT